jgi:hypothetical protein
MISNDTEPDDPEPGDVPSSDEPWGNGGHVTPELWLAQAQADRAIHERRHRVQAATWVTDRAERTLVGLMTEHTVAATPMALELAGGRRVVGWCELLGRDFVVMATGSGPRWHVVRLAAVTQLRSGGPIATAGAQGAVVTPGRTSSVSVAAWLADRLDERLDVMVWADGSCVRGELEGCSDDVLTIAGEDGSETAVVWAAVTDIAEL